MKRTWNLLQIFLVVLWATCVVRANDPFKIPLDSPQWSAVNANSITNDGVEITGVPKVGSIKLLKNVVFRSDDVIEAGLGSLIIPTGYFWLDGFPMWVSSARIVKSQKRVHLEVGIGLPSYIKNVNGEEIRVSGRVGVDSSGWHFDGFQFAAPDVYIKSLAIKNLTFAYDQAQSLYSGGANIGLGVKEKYDYCPDFEIGPPAYGGALELRDGQLNRLVISADDMRYPLGASLSYLDSLSAGIYDFATPGADWYVSGAFKINCGCPIILRGIKFYPLTLTGDARFYGSGYLQMNSAASFFKVPIANATMSYHPPYQVDAALYVNLLDILLADASIHFNSAGVSGDAHGKLQIPGYIPVVGGYQFASVGVGFDVRSDYYAFRGSVDVQITPEIPSWCTPEWCPGTVWMGCWVCDCGWDGCGWCNNYVTLPCVPPVCTPAIPAVQVHVAFRLENGDFYFNAPSTASDVAPWETHYQGRRVDPETGIRTIFFDNWDEIGKASTDVPKPSGVALQGDRPRVRPMDATTIGQPFTTFRVTGSNPEIMFRLAYQNRNAPTPIFEIKSPSGQIIRSGEGPLPTGYKSVHGFSAANAIGRDATVTLVNAEIGDYVVTVINPEKLGNYSVQALVENEKPLLQDLQVEETPTSGIYKVTWDNKDPEDAVLVKIHLNKDRDGKDGFPVGVVSAVQGVNTFLIDTSKVKVRPGAYHVHVTADDGRNEFVEAYTSRTIQVDDPEAPRPVSGFAVRPRATGFEVRWKPSPSPSVETYAILYTKEMDEGRYEGVHSVLASETGAIVDKLIPGQPYLVTVVAHDNQGRVSEGSEVLRVVPTPGIGRTPPKILSKPDIDATAGHRWAYLPQAFDGDEVQYGSISAEDGKATRPGGQLAWKLIQAPAGMTIHESGLLQWIPTGEQVGSHQVILEARERTDASVPKELASRLFDRQTFSVEVLPSYNLSALKQSAHGTFVHLPALTAVAGEKYVCPLDLLSTGQHQITLLDAPSGMVIKGDTLEWTPSVDTRGDRVHLKVRFAEGFEIEQSFYVDVLRRDNVIVAPAELMGVRSVPAGIELKWRANGARPITWPKSYQLQRCDLNLGGAWVNVGAPYLIKADAPHATHAVPTYSTIDTLPSNQSVFYRLLISE
jgi:hypothetical protein